MASEDKDFEASCYTKGEGLADKCQAFCLLLISFRVLKCDGDRTGGGLMRGSLAHSSDVLLLIQY